VNKEFLAKLQQKKETLEQIAQRGSKCLIPGNVQSGWMGL